MMFFVQFTVIIKNVIALTPMTAKIINVEVFG